MSLQGCHNSIEEISATSKKDNKIRLVGHSDLEGFGNGGQIVVKRFGRRKTFAFIGHMRGKAFTILDVTEPSDPEVLYQQPSYVGTRSHKLRVVRGRYLFLNCEKAPDAVGNSFDSGFRIFDLKDLANPEEVSYTKVHGRGVHRLWVDEESDVAYMPAYVDGFDGRILLLFDVKNLEKPRMISKWWYPGQNLLEGERPTWLDQNRSYRAHGPPIRLGNRIYLGYWDCGTLVLDCNDIEKVSLVSQRNLCPPYGGCTHTVLPVNREILARKWLVVTDEAMAEDGREEGKKVLWVMDATDETNIVPVSTYSVSEEGFGNREGRFGPHNLHEGDLSLRDDEVYVTWYRGGVRVLDISNPYKLKEKACFVPRPEPKMQRVIQTNDVYVDERGLIFTIDRMKAGVHVLEKNIF